MKDPHDLRQLLAGHNNGTETVYHHNLVRSFFYTDGARAFAQNAGRGAYWLLDILATEPQIREAVEQDGLMVVMLDVSGGAATLTVAFDLLSGEGEAPRFADVRFTVNISRTDCPEGRWTFYLGPTVVGETSGVMMMLPSER